MSDRTMNETALCGLVESVIAAHPAQAEVIRAFIPLLLTRNRLLRDTTRLGAGAGAADERQRPMLRLSSLGISDDHAHEVLLAVLDAIAEGFAELWESAARVRDSLEPATSLRLCEAWFADNRAVAEVLSAEHALSGELLVFAQGQACRILAAQATALLPDVSDMPESGSPPRCPCCGSAPELSVIHGTGGQRSLVCGQCGRAWRYARTACPGCGADGPEVLRSLYVENRPEERGVSCTGCNRYVLEVDIRRLDLGPEQCQALALGLGHLDVLMQQEGKRPLQSSGETSCEPRS